MKNERSNLLRASVLIGGCFLFTGCTSFSGEHLGAAYLCLLWSGVPVGFFVSACIWGNDEPGSYTPVWEVILWLFLVAAGAVLGYVKPFCTFFGFAAAVLVPSAGVLPVVLIVHILKKYRN
jgi:hypothetical protein